MYNLYCFETIVKESIGVNIMQLIYAYLNIESRKIKHKINFNSKFFLEYDETKKIIKISDNELYQDNKHFYGKNVDNMELIVGNNGAGKTAFLDLIGVYDADLFDRFTRNDEWFLIYEDNNKYVIEGHQKYSNDCIVNSIHFSKKVGSSFNGEFFYATLRRKNDELLFDSYNNKVDDNFIICYLPNKYNPISDILPNRKYSNYSYDSKFRYMREYLFYDLKKIYIFLNSKIFEELKFFNKEIKFKIRINENIENADSMINLVKHLHKDCPVFIMEHYYRSNGLKLDCSPCELFILKLLYLNLYKIFEFYISSYNKNATQQIDEKKFFKWLKSFNDSCQKLSSYNSIYKYLKRVILEIKSKIRETDNIHDSFDILFGIIEKLQTINKYKLLDFPSSTECNLKAYSYEVDDIKSDIMLGLLADLDSLKSYSFFGTFNFGLSAFLSGVSSGETQIIRIVSSLYSMPKYDSVLLVLDEPDIALHPEWSRKLVEFLCGFFDELKTKISVIMSTHSSLLLSDFFAKSIHLFKRNDDNYSIELANKTLCGNIGDLMINNFFIEKPFGEYSFGRIKDNIDLLKNSTGIIDSDKYKEIELLIDNIGDDLIKNTLKYYYEEKLKKDENQYHLIEYKRRLMKKLADEIEQMERKNVKDIL